MEGLAALSGRGIMDQIHEREMRDNLDKMAALYPDYCYCDTR